MRQDQLIMQMIMLMDQLLKKVNMDLKLRPYGILATGCDDIALRVCMCFVCALLTRSAGSCSKKDGIMEFVAGSAPVSHVLANNNQSILAYLKKHNADPNGPMGVSARAIETFVKSCAGYCVITFILGIGDRHLGTCWFCED
jgi:phosphatidylinositol 3-kinase